MCDAANNLANIKKTNDHSIGTEIWILTEISIQLGIYDVADL